tara:strand:+ start:1661 stop:2599 length:939 start_codon:yes stop_codon:yes gene_type:complete
MEFEKSLEKPIIEQTTEDNKTFMDYTSKLGSPLPPKVVKSSTSLLGLPVIPDKIASPTRKRKLYEDTITPSNEKLTTVNIFDKTWFEVINMHNNTRQVMKRFDNKRDAVKYIKTSGLIRAYLVLIKHQSKMIPLMKSKRSTMPAKKKIKRTAKSNLMNMVDFFHRNFGTEWTSKNDVASCLNGRFYKMFANWDKQKGKRNIWFIDSKLPINDSAEPKDIRKAAMNAKCIPVCDLQREILNKFGDNVLPDAKLGTNIQQFVQRMLKAYPSYYDPTDKKEAFKPNVFCMRLRRECYKAAKAALLELQKMSESSK